MSESDRFYHIGDVPDNYELGEKVAYLNGATMAHECQQVTIDELESKLKTMGALVDKKDEALGKIEENTIDSVAADVAKQALALTADSVELVEVGRWVEGDTEEESDFYPISYCGRDGSGEMCYTIKVKP